MTHMEGESLRGKAKPTEPTEKMSRKEAIERLKSLIEFSNNKPGTDIPHYHITESAGECKGGDVIAEVIKALENSSPDDSAETAIKDKIGYEVFRLLNIPNEDWDDVISEQWALLGRITGNADDEQGLVRIGAEWGKSAEAHSERDSAQEGKA